MKRALQRLRKIDLKLNARHARDDSPYTGPEHICPWPIILEMGCLAETLADCHYLEELNLMLDKPDESDNRKTTHIPNLEKLIGTYTLTALRSVTLGYMVVDEDKLLAFLNRQALTLQKLRMVQMSVLSDEEDLQTNPFTEDLWQQTYHPAGRKNVALNVLIIE